MGDDESSADVVETARREDFQHLGVVGTFALLVADSCQTEVPLEGEQFLVGGWPVLVVYRADDGKLGSSTFSKAILDSFVAENFEGFGVEQRERGRNDIRGFGLASPGKNDVVHGTIS